MAKKPTQTKPTPPLTLRDFARRAKSKAHQTAVTVGLPDGTAIQIEGVSIKHPLIPGPCDAWDCMTFTDSLWETLSDAVLQAQNRMPPL